MGVDGFPALYAKALVGVNLADHPDADIVRHLGPLLSERVRQDLEVALKSRTTYLAGVDVSYFGSLERTLMPYRLVSPKSILLKSLFPYAFQKEWDPDNERYYEVARAAAELAATHWIAKLVDWMQVGDTLVVADRALSACLPQSPALAELDTDFAWSSASADVAYATSVPVVFLTHHARVLRKISA